MNYNFLTAVGVLGKSKYRDIYTHRVYYIRIVHLYIIKVIYSPTTAQVNCLKNNINIYIKITPTCFGVVAPYSGSSLSVLAKVTFC